MKIIASGFLNEGDASRENGERTLMVIRNDTNVPFPGSFKERRIGT